MPAAYDLSHRVALVTGGNSGIGLAIADAFAQAGAQVAIFGRNAEKNQAAQEQLRAHGKDAMALEVDVTSEEGLEDGFGRVEANLGAVSILVNNAGVGASTGILQMEAADWHRVIRTNLTAPFLLCRLAASSMAEQKTGKIINIASVGGMITHKSPAYGASKAGLLHLTRCLANELAPFNIQVNSIAPGWIDTALAQRAFERVYDSIIDLTPASRVGTPREVAEVALYLASDASDFTTGSTVVVDGGLTLGRVS